MTLFNPTAILVGFLLLYLSSFLIFAIVRVATGISIQRIGYFSLRRIAYAPREGVHIELRSLGLSLHPPTFARPTWISIKARDLKVTLDPRTLGKDKVRGATKHGSPDSQSSSGPSDGRDGVAAPRLASRDSRSGTWKWLVRTKEILRRINSQVNWLTLVDVVAINTTVHYVDAGYVQVGSLSLAVDTGLRMMERGKVLHRKKDRSPEQRPVEWITNVHNVMLAVDGREPTELLDNVTITAHGLLRKHQDGLRDASVAMKIGRMHIPYDDLMVLLRQTKKHSSHAKTTAASEANKGPSVAQYLEELDKPGSQEDVVSQKVADYKEFLSSLLRGIQEVQVALSFFRFSRCLQSFSPDQNAMYMNVVSHELDIDIHRMDQGSPSHRMYFLREDVAHQALLAAISLSVSLDDDNILYVPMATTTIKTTLPSKTVSPFDDHNPEERNKNILFANLVVTSPSLDLEPRRISQLLAIARSRAVQPRPRSKNDHRVISRLLPKASVKVSVHEPVLRCILPITEGRSSANDDYNLLISSISSVSLDSDSSHSAEGGVYYSLSSTYRAASYNLYYQTPSGVKHNLLTVETLEFKMLLNATPEVSVIASGNMNTFSAHFVNDEVNRGIHEVVELFRAHIQSKKKLSRSLEDQKPSPLRRLPPWLLRFQFEASGISVEIAGVDSVVSEIPRGVSFQLESWTADYKAQKYEPSFNFTRRRTPSHSTIGGSSPFRINPTSPTKTSQHGATDGRRLALHVRGLEGFVIESDDYLEPEAFLSLPRFEVALRTTSDRAGPMFQINSMIKGIYLRYSLYRLYCLSVAVYVLQDAFMRRYSESSPPTSEQEPSSTPTQPSRVSFEKNEAVSVDVRTTVLQVKASLPSDPPMLLQIYGITVGRHHSSPFVKSSLVRIHAEAPRLKGIWARIISLTNVRLDLRTIKVKHGTELVDEKSVEVWLDFIRMGVPHHMIMHRIFDNLINTTKALKQLHERFKNPSNDLTAKRDPEEPKKLPRISVRSKALLFELEDDAFEWKLGCIYRTGLREQGQRLAREDAFRLKSQKIKESSNRRPSPHKPRARSSQRNLRGESKRPEIKRSKSADTPRVLRSDDTRNDRSSKYRYDAEGAACLSSDSNVSIDDAWYRLQKYNAESWKQKIDTAMRFQSASMREIRQLFSGADEPPEDVNGSETVLSIPNRPGLMSALVSDVNIVIDRPSFPLEEFPSFLTKIGKGIPTSTQYALLIPMSIQLDMGEARVNLRDYPLDLLHVPALRPGQSPRLSSWSLRTNFVIAEEYRDYRSSRQVQLELVPPTELPDGSKTQPFHLDVWRSVSPVKTYSDPTVEINTSLPTSISWGMSYQPVIQDMMKIIEGFTKPEIDPSERVGFWDKIRLSFHSRIRVSWKEDGDVHLRLKGSRDPYSVTSYGAGFVMCWRKDVKWDIHTSDDPKEFMSVTSGEYVLAVPDYCDEARYASQAPLDERDSSSTSLSSDEKNAAMFKKVIMKLSGDVKWVVGLVFERNYEGDRRSFSFTPHYDVVLRNPKFIDPSQQQDYDAFRGFRSHHIHLSIAVIAPENRNWSVDSIQPSASYNAVHLTPRFFTHFFKWWSLFSGVMSLPVRQGPLWPGVTKTNKKFARHLATVKYKLLFAPLFGAHVYKHKDREDYDDDFVTATGWKVRLDSLKLDVHQRRENVLMHTKGHQLKQQKASAMRINQAQLDLQAADFRAISASIGGTSIEDVEAKGNNDIISSFQQPVASVDLSRFTIPDQNLDWIDMDDLVELGWILPQESNPRTQILPLAFTPHFTYFRQTDHGDISPDDAGYSSFGDEPTHVCMMSEINDPRRVQMELIRDRLATMETQILNFERTISEQRINMTNPTNGDKPANGDNESKGNHDTFVRQVESLQRRRSFLTAGLRRLERQLARDERGSGHAKGDGTASETSSKTGVDSETSSDGKGLDGLYASANDDFVSDFNNRFIIHNAQLKWNNSLRNIMLRYIHQVSQRRGFVYYMSRRAVKFILDIVKEQNENNRNQSFANASQTRSAENGSGENDDDNISVEERIEQLLNDAKRYVNAEEPEAHPKRETRAASQSSYPDDIISPEFTPQNSYHLRLIAPQIQLQSEKNQKSVLLVAAKGMQLKVVSIMDKDRVYDDVSGLVQRRFSLEMDGAQFFVATRKNLLENLQFYAGNKYGNIPGSAWPPWITMEAMFDFELNPFGFSRIIQKTSASLRYDKYNNMRLKYNGEVAKGNEDPSQTSVRQEPRMDQIKVDFPHFRAICDSDEYYTMYIIVLDLLLYSEPLEKVRNERLERIMLTADFSDLRGAPEMVYKLQDRIRKLEEIKEYFQVHAKYLDKSAWEDCMELEKDLANCEDELFFLTKAITTSQRRVEPSSSKTNGVLRWSISASDVVWHLMKNQSERLVEFQLRNAEYGRTDNSDGSNHNSVSVERLYGLNLLPDAIYPEIIVPYLEPSQKPGNSDDYMVRVKWHMLEAVAGIPVLDDFEVTLFPLKIQLERELGQRVFEYIFPGFDSENGGFSPFAIKNNMKLLDDDDSEKESDLASSHNSPNSSHNSSSDDLKRHKGPGAIEQRLRPTFMLSDDKKTHHRLPNPKELVMTPMKESSPRLGLGPSDASRQASRPSSSGASTLSKKRSYDSLRVLKKQNNSKPNLAHPATIGPGPAVAGGEERGRKFHLGKGKSKENRDDLSQMISRAANYMTLAHIRVNDVVLCMSYKGKGDRNLEDIHDFVFRLPVLEYWNKTWSNLDLALRLKKDVTKALISHAPAILGNKFSHHRPSKLQQKRDREMASSSLMLRNPESSSATITASEKSPASLTSFDTKSERSGSPSRISSSNSNALPLARPASVDSGSRSLPEDSEDVYPRSLNEADFDSRWEESRKVRPPIRPMTSGTTIRPTTSSTTANGGEHNERPKKSVFGFGRKLMHPRK